MSKIYVKTYNNYSISGADFATVTNTTMRRIVFSPDHSHSLVMNELRDGCLCITNPNDIPFEFSISRNQRIIANVKQSGNKQVLNINSNWRITENQVENWEIHANPDLYKSRTLNIDLDHGNGIGRIDLKINNSGFAGCIFSNALMFVRFNGNHVVPRLLGIIQNEVIYI